jgi:hypothetical protein
VTDVGFLCDRGGIFEQIKQVDQGAQPHTCMRNKFELLMHVHACTLRINVRESIHLNEQTDRNQFRRLTSVHALIVN